LLVWEIILIDLQSIEFIELGEDVEVFLLFVPDVLIGFVESELLVGVGLEGEVEGFGFFGGEVEEIEGGGVLLEGEEIGGEVEGVEESEELFLEVLFYLLEGGFDLGFLLYLFCVFFVTVAEDFCEYFIIV
jgi:hypothetical protein